jgi:four helix bundle protein
MRSICAVHKQVTSHQSPVSSGGTHRSYKQLKVWEKSTEMVLLVYAATAKFPKEEMYGLTSQVRRCAVSVPSNIAEGSERKSDKDFMRFLRMANASLAELETQLFIALKLSYLEEAVYMQLLQANTEIGKMINGLSTKLEARALPTGDWRLATGD